MLKNIKLIAPSNFIMSALIKFYTGKNINLRFLFLSKNNKSLDADNVKNYELWKLPFHL